MEIMWDIPFILEPNQTLTYVMSSRSTSLEPKSQLTINLDLGWECPSLLSEENKKKEKKKKAKEKVPNQKSEESKRKKILDQGSEENRRNMQKSREPNQTLTYVMSNRSTSLEPKSQLTIHLDPGWECQSLLSEENKEKIPNQRLRESKKKENSRSKIGRKQKKYAERSLDQTISEQYRIVTQ